MFYVWVKSAGQSNSASRRSIDDATGDTRGRMRIATVGHSQKQHPTSGPQSARRQSESKKGDNSMSHVARPRTLSDDTIAEFECKNDDIPHDTKQSHDLLLSLVKDTLEVRVSELQQRMDLARYQLMAHADRLVEEERAKTAEAESLLPSATEAAEEIARETDKLRKSLSHARSHRERAAILKRLRSLARQMEGVYDQLIIAQSTIGASVRRIEAEIPEVSVAWNAILQIDGLRNRLNIQSLLADLRDRATRAAAVVVALTLTLVIDRLADPANTVGRSLFPSDSHTAAILILFWAQLLIFDRVAKTILRVMYSRTLARLVKSARLCLKQLGEAETLLVAAEVKISEMLAAGDGARPPRKMSL